MSFFDQQWLTSSPWSSGAPRRRSRPALGRRRGATVRKGRTLRAPDPEAEGANDIGHPKTHPQILLKNHKTLPLPSEGGVDD